MTTQDSMLYNRYSRSHRTRAKNFVTVIGVTYDGPTKILTYRYEGSGGPHVRYGVMHHVSFHKRFKVYQGRFN
jgi:hypothetical protein